MVYSPVSVVFTWCDFRIEINALGSIRPRETIRTFHPYPTISSQMRQANPFMLLWAVLLFFYVIFDFFAHIRTSVRRFHEGQWPKLRSYLLSTFTMIDIFVTATVITQFCFELRMYRSFLYQNFNKESSATW